MNVRMGMVIFGLVILPTAVLTFLAARSLRNWELILRSQMEESARNALQTAAVRIDGELGADLDVVRAAVSDALAAGGEPSLVSNAVAHVRASRPTVGDIFVFANPWGFLWPPASAEEAPGAEAMLTVLRRESSSAEPRGSLRFRTGDRAYCFAPLEGRRMVYVGYAVEPAGLASRLARELADLSRGNLLLFADGPGWAISGAGDTASDDVVVSDSLDPRPSVSRGLTHEGQAVIAALRLGPPLDAVRLEAVVKDPGRLQHLGRMQSSLFRWGIVLLAAGITAGAWFLAWQGAAEVRKARARADFVVGVSHDLRTPLASMQVLAESLYMEHVTAPERRREFAGSILNEARRLQQLIERVLFFVRLGQDAMVYALQRASAGDLVGEAVRAFETQRAAAGAGGRTAGRVRLTVGDGLPAVLADASALGQVVFNLVDNAWKYGRAEGGEADVAVCVDAVRRRRPWAAAARDWVRIRVEDRGPGMGRRELARVFEPYYRGEQGRQRNLSGVGLGLALCRHVVRAHGGWIEAQSRPGQGSAFSIHLPVAGDA